MYGVKRACMPYIRLEYMSDLDLFEIFSVSVGECILAQSKEKLYLSPDMLKGLPLDRPLAIAFEKERFPGDMYGGFNLVSATGLRPVDILSFAQNDKAVLYQDGESKASYKTGYIQMLEQPRPSTLP